MLRPEGVFINKMRRIHFVGIGGIGMSGIAELMLRLNFEVSGSDLRKNDQVRRLEELGAHIDIGHSADNVEQASVVVYSSAVRPDNPELVRARDLGLPVIPRAEMLAELMRFAKGIAVAGSHGKTTTTSMVATILETAGYDPTVVIGGKINAFGSNARHGTGELMVVEADESDGSFLFLRPMATIVTNIDPEHMDHYRDLDELKRTFADFMSLVPFYGFNVVWAGDSNIRSIMDGIHRRIVTFGTSPDADYMASDIRMEEAGTSFEVHKAGKPLGRVSLRMFGEHNVRNALAALAVAMELDVPFSDIRRAMEGFSGVDRRFTVRGTAGGVTVVDDYAHHPTEISAVLNACRQAFPGRRVVALFQPHRYSRVRALFQDFARCFSAADEVRVMDIYPAGEAPIPGVDSDALVQAISQNGMGSAIHVPGDPQTVASALARFAREGDIILTLGAGSVTSVGPMVLELLGGG